MKYVAPTLIGSIAWGVGLGHYYTCYKKINAYKQVLRNINKTEEFKKYEADVDLYNYYKDRADIHFKYGETGTYYIYDGKTEIKFTIPPEFVIK